MSPLKHWVDRTGNIFHAETKTRTHTHTKKQNQKETNNPIQPTEKPKPNQTKKLTTTQQTPNHNNQKTTKTNQKRSGKLMF